MLFCFFIRITFNLYMQTLCRALLLYFHQIMNVLGTGLIVGICARRHIENIGMHIVVTVFTLNILSSNKIQIQQGRNHDQNKINKIK